jgi:hypothetical protein
MTETVTTPTKTNKAELIRTLLKDKNKTRAQIAEEVGCKVQYVFSVQNHDRVRARKLKAKRKLERQAELRNGAPKRKYTKSGKFAKTVPAPTTPMVEPVVKTQYIEVEVPQPFSHYTFWQRLRILFLGRAA